MNKNMVNTTRYLILTFIILLAGLSQSHAITISASQPARANQPHTFIVNVTMQQFMLTEVQMDWGEGAGLQYLTEINQNANMTLTHTYAAPGVYQVRCYAFPKAFGAPVSNVIPPNPATFTINVIAPNHVVGLSAGPQPIPLNQTETFRISVDLGANAPSFVEIDYGDGGGYQPVAQISQDTNLTATHAYTRPGLYVVRARVLDSANGLPLPFVPSASNPATTRVRVTDFQIQRIELVFDNNRPEITLDRNQTPPELMAKIKYSGNGYLKGYWEVDGLRRSYVFKHLRTGPYITFKYPKIPPLPTFSPGTHLVRFIITSPVMNIDFPQAIYFVTPKEDTPMLALNLISPAVSEILEFTPPEFTWETDFRVSTYLIELFADSEEKPVFSAYARKGSYQLRDSIFNARFSPGENYEWQVSGFNKKDELIAKSEKQDFSFKKDADFVPGNILMITSQTPEGRKAVMDAKQAYSFQVLQQYPIKSLKLNAILFYTDDDIFDIVDALKNKPGVVLVQPNFIFNTLAEPMSALQGYLNISLLNNIQKTVTGKNIRVGVIDTGIDTQHKDLSGAVAFQSNFLTNNNYRPEIHGTAIAGLIGARNNDFGISGLAPGARILALRACRQVSENHPKGECYSSSMIQAIDAGIEQQAHIINMSLGARREDPTMSKLITEGTRRGVIFVAPAGNYPGLNRMAYPASHPDVVSVGGLKENGRFFPNEIIAQKADICAPCQNILTTVPTDDHNFMDGTSMSTAIISGLIALSLEKNPGFDESSLKSMNNDIEFWMNSISK